MKPAPFEYARPASVDEACALLAADDGARLIAGGQTLVPLMAMRLARPSRLIDIARIRELAFVRDEGGAIAIGAATRQCVVERDPLVREKLPLLARVMPVVGHAATRARGTIGGSLANGDPAAEIVLVAATLDASLTWRDGGGFLPWTDGDMPAARGLSHGGAVSGLAGAAGRHRLSRGERAPE
jgi:carbon-monoxide dehydrogenase medium subunit